MIPPIVFAFAGKALVYAFKELGKESKPAAPSPNREPEAKPRRQDRSGVAQSSQPAPPRKIISLVGRTSVGKSSLGNALAGEEAFSVGVEHGTTSQAQSIPFRHGYWLQDTPGLLDGETYDLVVMNAARSSELVVFVAGQLYRQELDFLRELGAFQSAWNRSRGARPRRSTAIFLNACDLKALTMPSRERTVELDALGAQIGDCLPGGIVLSGAAAPVDGAAPEIAALEEYLAGFLRRSASWSVA
jgi:hypothetical protein